MPPFSAFDSKPSPPDPLEPVVVIEGLRDESLEVLGLTLVACRQCRLSKLFHRLAGLISEDLRQELRQGQLVLGSPAPRWNGSDWRGFPSSGSRTHLAEGLKLLYLPIQLVALSNKGRKSSLPALNLFPEVFD